MDHIRYKPGQYQPDLKRMVSLDLKDDSTTPSTPEKKDSYQLGFDMATLTSNRGHFVDNVSMLSKRKVWLSNSRNLISGETGYQG